MSGKLQLEVSSADIRRLLRNGDLPWIRRVVFVGDVRRGERRHRRFRVVLVAGSLRHLGSYGGSAAATG
jgi:hypothetical protein